MPDMREKYLVFTGRPMQARAASSKKVIGIDVATGKQPGTTRRIRKYPLSGGLSLINNKIDKVRGEGIATNLKELMHQASGGHPQAIEDYIFPVSAKTGEGLGALKSAIYIRLVGKGFKTPFKLH